MLILKPSMQRVAADLVAKQEATGLEHYWAQDGSGWIDQQQGQPDHVKFSPELERSSQTLGAAICYHHSHPDDRALSYHDLIVLERFGMKEVWAHSPSGCSYGAESRRNFTGNYLREQLDKLNGHFEHGIFEYKAKHDPHFPAMTKEEYEEFHNIAACEALDALGLIHAPIRLSDAMRRRYNEKTSIISALRGYFYAVLLPPKS